MSADCSYLRFSTAFLTVRAAYCSADGIGSLVLLLVNVFPDGLLAVLLSRWQHLARSSTRQRLSWFARRIAQQMSADCSYLRFSTAFPTVRAPYCTVDSIESHVLPLVNGFHDGLRAVLPSGW